MSLLGKKRQILCITHLPQIAAMADNHFRIEKHVAEGRTTTTVETLDENASCREIARLMGGEEITETKRTAAGKTLRKTLLTSKIYIATMSLFIGGCVIQKRLQPDKMAGESPASYPAFFCERRIV